MSRQTALRLILGGAAIWLLLVVIVLIDDPDDALVLPVLVALAMAGFGWLSYSRHSKPWGWAALIVSALAAAMLVSRSRWRGTTQAALRTATARGSVSPSTWPAP